MKIYCISDKKNNAKDLCDMVKKAFNISNIDMICYDWMMHDKDSGVVSNRKYDANGQLIFEDHYSIENYFRTAMNKIKNMDIIVVDWSSTSELIAAQAEYAKEIGKFVMYVEPELDYLVSKEESK